MQYQKISSVCAIDPSTRLVNLLGQEISYVPMKAVSTAGQIDLSQKISVDKIKNYSVFQNGDVLFAKITPCMENGKGAVANRLCNGYGAGSTEFLVLRPDTKQITSKWLYHFLSQRQFRLECAHHMTGTAGQKRVKKSFVSDYEIPLPSLTEQERIVARIEELFSELDNAVETLQTTKRQLTVYRQAVLKDCFATLETVKANSICIHITDGDHMPPPKAESGIPFIMISNIENGKISWEGTNYVSQSYFNEIGEKRTPRRGDVLYTVTGSYGIPVRVDFDRKFCFQRHIALLRPNDMVLQDFLYYALQTPIVFQQATKRATGTAQKTVGLSVLRDLDIPFVASKDTQRKTVFTVESRLSVCDSIEQTVDASLQQAEAMRQSILKKTFEGRL